MFARTKPFYGQNYEQDTIKVRNIPSHVLISDKPRLGARKRTLRANNPFSFLVSSQTNASLPDDSCDWTELLNRDNPWSQRRFLLSWCLERVSQTCYDVMNANKYKNKQQINTHHNARKNKRCKYVKNAALFWNDKFLFFENKDSACPWGKEVILIRRKDVRENKTVLRSELWAWCNKGERYSFMCPN